MLEMLRDIMARVIYWAARNGELDAAEEIIIKGLEAAEIIRARNSTVH